MQYQPTLYGFNLALRLSAGLFLKLVLGAVQEQSLPTLLGCNGLRQTFLLLDNIVKRHCESNTQGVYRDRAQDTK